MVAVILLIAGLVWVATLGVGVLVGNWLERCRIAGEPTPLESRDRLGLDFDFPTKSAKADDSRPGATTNP